MLYNTLTSIPSKDLFLIPVVLLLDILVIMKITKWRPSVALLSSIFINLISATLALIVLIFAQKNYLFLLKIFGYLLIPFVYFNLPNLATIVLTILTLIPLLGLKPLFKLFSLKLFSSFIKSKQIFGPRGFWWLFLANIIFMFVTIFWHKLL